MRIELHPDARAELRFAASWYEERREDTGDRFVAAIAATLGRISTKPESFPRWLGAPPSPSVIRRASVDRFPYLVAFEQHANHILVLAVAHQKRRPLYWLERSSKRTV